jgi:3-oxoadipate enol-lactonase
MPKADINGISYNYKISGNGEPVVLISGFGGNLGFWRRATEILERSMTVISVDNRGAGETVYSGSFTMDDMADDIITLLNHLGYENAHILGWSMGSHIAQNLAIRHPDKVRTLSLISTYRLRPARTAYMLKLGMDVMKETGSGEIFGKILNGLGYPEEYFKKKEAEGTDVRVALFDDVSKLADQFSAIDGNDTSESAGKISVPTFTVHGTDDIMVTVEEGDALADLIPDCKRLRIDGAGHLIPSDYYIPEVLKFIKDNS